jgi:hypothetical protein
LLGLPSGSEFLSLGELGGGHLFHEEVALLRDALIPLRRREAQPQMCLDEVLLGTPPIGVQEPEAALGVGVPLLRGLAIPADTDRVKEGRSL